MPPPIPKSFEPTYIIIAMLVMLIAAIMLVLDKNEQKMRAVQPEPEVVAS
jgi:hypothetical protein